MENINKRLIQLREERGLNGVEMAKKLGVNKSTIARYESGEIKPNLDMMIVITQMFGVSLDWLAGYDTTTSASYEPVIRECIKANISPERLMQAVKLLKG
jgi:transcriptional regulator with XRE-family HTH domain